jgi:RNA polymerase sigma-70 factor (ECF subfamily)
MLLENDEILMQGLQEGNNACLGKLYERYKTILLNYFINVTQDRDAANDLLMEVFERIYKYRGGFDVSRKFKPWMYQMSNNLLHDYRNKLSKHKSLENSKEEISYLQSYTFQQIDRGIILKDAMGRLSESERKVISMYYLLEIPYSEIAQIEGVSVNSIRIRVCRALKNLNAIITNSGIKEL